MTIHKTCVGMSEFCSDYMLVLNMGLASLNPCVENTKMVATRFGLATKGLWIYQAKKRKLAAIKYIKKRR